MNTNNLLTANSSWQAEKPCFKLLKKCIIVDFIKIYLQHCLILLQCRNQNSEKQNTFRMLLIQIAYSRHHSLKENPGQSLFYWPHIKQIIFMQSIRRKDFLKMFQYLHYFKPSNKKYYM